MTALQPPQQPTPPSKSGGGSESALAEAVKAIPDFGKTALKGLRGPQRVAIFAIGIVGIVALFVSVVAASVSVLITVAATIAFIVLLLAGSKSASSAASTWCRAVPRLPIRNPDLTQLSQLLQHICHEAYDYLKNRSNRPELASGHVRTNVFLADYKDPGEGYAFNLYMPDELRRNMNHPPEWELRFRPGQGATGVTFVSGSQRVTKRQPDEEGDWEARFELTDDQKQMVHPDLKWIVSVPLKDTDNGTTLGVMNIDGLTYDFSDGQLSQMLAVLFREITAFSELLTKQPRATLSIHVDEEKTE